MRSSWTHAICLTCFRRERGEDPLYVIVEEYREDEACCFCGTDTKEGVYLRAEPNQPFCDHEKVNA